MKYNKKKNKDNSYGTGNDIKDWKKSKEESTTLSISEKNKSLLPKLK